jgi:uncharacterized protein YoxC
MNAGIFHEPWIDFTHSESHTPRPMAPAAVAIIVLCVVAVSAVLVWTLLAVRKTALRAESVLRVVEHEIRPMLGQLESLIAELRDLSQGAKEELSKIRVVVRRAEDVSITVSKLVIAVGGLTRIGQYVSLAAGVKKGLDVFVRRLKATR